MEKIVSFIIPSYNVEKYLQTCLDSFLDFNVLNKIEVIVVNDGSLDQTAHIAEEYVKRYPESFRLVNKENGGHGSAINTGTQVAVGKYLKVIDADDWIVTENLSAFLEKLDTCSSDVVLTPYHQVNIMTGERTIWKMFLDEYEKEYTLSDVVNHWKAFDRCLAFHGITYKRAFYQEHRYELPGKIFYEDHEYATIPCSYAKNIYPIDLYIYQYMIGNAEQSVAASNRLKRISHVERVTEDLIRHYNGSKELSDDAREYIFKKLEGVILSYYVVSCLINPDKKKGRSDCRKYNEMIVNLNPDIFSRVRRKYGVYLWMNRLHISFSQYESMLKSRIYNLIRKNKKIESEK